VRLSILLVGNTPQPSSLQAIRSCLADWRSDTICGTAEEIYAWFSENPERFRTTGCVYLIENNEIRVYSAGNNIGIRLADTLNADAAMIANLDMRINNLHYIAALAKALFANDKCLIAALRILGHFGKNHNLLREPTLWKELSWPRFYLSKIFKRLVPISFY